MPSSTSLPPKENSLFKRIIKCHEYKLYRTGLKFAKQILSNPQFSEHGETLAMKGLILNCLGRKEEAYEHVRRGLRNNLKSHICWHVYGLLQRSDKKYDEAIKCYRNALKWEKDHIQILKDLSNLQIQMRDLEGYRDTRYQLFMLRPTQLISWMGFAMAYHLLKDYEMTLKVLETLRKTLVSSIQGYERSEILLYQNMVIQESGNLQGALDHLLESQTEICDTLAVEESFAKLYLKLGKNEEAEKKIHKLLDRNPENIMYYELIQQALGLENDLDKLRLLQQHEESYPNAHACKRLILNFAHGDDFKTEVEKYLQKGLRKGVPSLFVDLRSLYKDSVKVGTIETLLVSYAASLKKNGTFSMDDKSGLSEPPSALLWVYYFLAQHYDHLGLTNQALIYINIAIDHTPTLIELFVAKGRIYKHAGDALEAFRWIDEAQGLDTADRYINSKCAKYMLRADMIEEAEETCARFTREGISAMENLNEMQCMWFQTECAFAYKRRGNWGEALKKCHEVDRHFTDIVEDQFDFHTYCMKKMTFRSYIELLRLEDVLRSHRFYKRAASCAISVYLTLHDKPISDKIIEEQQDIENLTPSELKKLRNKQRKARKKAELVANAERKETQRPRQTYNDSDNDGSPQDELVPDKLARVADPLEQAIKFLCPLQKLCSSSVDTHLMAYEIYSRKRKPLLMLQSVKRAHGVASVDHPKVHSIIVQMALEMQVWDAQKSLSVPVSVVVKRQMEPILKGRSPAKMNQDFIKNHSDLASRLQGARMLYRIDPAKKVEALKLLTALDDSVEGVTIENCLSVKESLLNGDFGPCESVLEEFRLFCKSKYPYATALQKQIYSKPSNLVTKKLGVGIHESNCVDCISD